jgi:hypothetical protein
MLVMDNQEQFMIELRLRRSRLYASGMRMVDMSHHYKIDLWAQSWNTDVQHYVDPEDESWVCLEFLDDKYALWFLLSYEHDMGIYVNAGGA